MTYNTENFEDAVLCG